MNDLKANKSRELREKLAKYWFLFNALVGIISVMAIAVFVFYKGLQGFFSANEAGQYSFIKFISGLEWRPNDISSKANYGIFYMIVGSLASTAGAIFIGVPIAILTAIFISELAPDSINKILNPAVELLAGIPSVLYGIFGLGFIVPKLMKISPSGRGQSLLAVVIVLSVMILPTVISISTSAIMAVPNSYKEGAYALGASKIQAIFFVILPAARSGISAAIILGIGRAIGETMAVMMVAGNPLGGLPNSIWSQVKPLTTNIAMGMGYAEGLHRQMMFATAVVLFVFIIIINLILSRIKSKMQKET